MSQTFKLRYDQMRENDPSKSDPSQNATDAASFYQSAGYARSLCLILENGNRAFLSYAYLISGEFDIEDEINLIRLHFSSAVVVLKGYSLEELFMQLMDQMPRIIQVIDQRYATLAEQVTIVTEIVITRKETE